MPLNDTIPHNNCRMTSTKESTFKVDGRLDELAQYIGRDLDYFKKKNINTMGIDSVRVVRVDDPTPKGFLQRWLPVTRDIRMGRLNVAVSTKRTTGEEYVVELLGFG